MKVVMPQMGESITEGTVVRWLKAPGDAVARDEPLFEISTDKVDTEVPSPAGGTLKEILVPEGRTVGVGTPVASLETETAIEAGMDAPRAATAAAATTPESTGVPLPESGGHFRATQPTQVVSFRHGSMVGRPAARIPGGSYSPAVLEAARRGGMSLGALTGLRGSGRGGRVTKRDVEAYLRDQGSGVAQIMAPTDPTRALDEYLYRPGPEDQRVPMSPARRTMARHMSWSTRISPHATAFTECDMSRVTALIERAGDRFGRRVGAPLTCTVLAAQAAVQALGGFPALNASVVGDEIILKPTVHLGIAVALADTAELVVPVIHAADTLSLAGIALAVQDLAARARARRLQPPDVQGGTFTLTNPGIFGGFTGTPILHQPQVAILGLGAITRRAVVVDEAIAIRPMMMLSVTFDHRAADGMIAFRYLDRVRRLLDRLPDDLNPGC